MLPFAATSPRLTASLLKPFDVIGSSKSVSKWIQQFTSVVHNPALSLPTGTPLWNSAEVFAKLRIDDKVLCNPPKDKRVYEHCGIAQVMERMKRLPTMADGVPDRSEILHQNGQMVKRLAVARREELTSIRVESKIDLFAMSFLTLNGFDADPFDITAACSNFDIFGKPRRRAAEHLVVVTPSNDLVLVFEDKLLKFGEGVQQQGHLGQVVGELLQLLSVNCVNEAFRSVFAVRFINYHVTAFRVDVGKATLKSLVEVRRLPRKKLPLQCSDAAPMKNRGLSLIDPIERVKALQLMADIRNFIVNTKSGINARK